MIRGNSTVQEYRLFYYFKGSTLQSEPQRELLVFQVSGRTAAVPLADVEKITPMVQLAGTPGLPAALEGILNLAGTAIPVLRLDYLLRLPEKRPGLYSMLIVLRRVGDGQVAFLVDRVNEILSVSESGLLPLGAEDSFNACAEATVPVRGQIIPLLVPARILLEKERRFLSEFQVISQKRLQDWEVAER
jgi:chemotaxis signal transduction protein